MKILLGINALSSGGAEVFTAELAVAYTKKGHDVFLVTYAGILNEKGEDLKKYLIKNNVTLIDFSLKSKILLILYYIKLVLKLKPQLIHSNLEQTDLLLIITKLFSKKTKYFRTLHNIKVFEKYPLWVNKMLFKYYDKNIGCSHYTKTHYQIEELRELIIPIDNGVDVSRLSDTVSFNERKSSNLNQTTFIVIGTSQKRFGEYQKGHDLIVEVFKEIKEDYKVIFLGNLENMEIDFPEVKNNPNYKLIGVTSNINTYIEVSDFVLAPSRFEGLPISTIEAVCSGLPLICSDIEGFLPFTQNSTLVFENENLNDLKDKIEIAINQKDLYKSKGLINKELYIKQFDINEVGSKYLNLL